MTNKIHSVLGEGLSVLLSDIFSDLAGPRIRDKISHGEWCLKHLPKGLANYVYCAGLCVSLKAIIYKNTKVKSNYKEYGDKCLIKNVSGETEAFFQKLIKSCDMYTSKYHVVSRLIQSMKNILNRVDQWPQFAAPTDLVKLEEINSGHVTSLQNCLFGDSDNFSAISCKIGNILSKIKPKTLFRPRNEIELVSLLKNITEKIACTEVKIEECVCLKYKQWEEHALHSRNRLTFQRMLQVLPDLRIVLLCLLGIITSFIKNVSDLQQGNWKSYLRFTKGMLRLAENMASYCTVERNRWLEAHKIASEFSEISVQFLVDKQYLLIYNE